MGAGLYFQGNINHNLGVVPELVISKQRDGTNHWYVWTTGFSSNEQLVLNLNYAKGNWAGAIWGTMTNTQIGLASAASGNGIYYLFATLPNISKV